MSDQIPNQMPQTPVTQEVGTLNNENKPINIDQIIMDFFENGGFYTESEKEHIRGMIGILKEFKEQNGFALPLVMIGFGTRGDVFPIINATQQCKLINTLVGEELIILYSLLPPEFVPGLKNLGINTVYNFGDPYKEVYRFLGIGVNTDTNANIMNFRELISKLKSICIKFVRDYKQNLEIISKDLENKYGEKVEGLDVTQLLQSYSSWSYTGNVALLNKQNTPVVLTQATAQITSIDQDGIPESFMSVEMMQDPILRRFFHLFFTIITGAAVAGNTIQEVNPENQQPYLLDLFQGAREYLKGIDAIKNQFLAFPRTFIDPDIKLGERVVFTGYPHLMYDLSMLFDEDLNQANERAKLFVSEAKNSSKNKVMVISPGSLESKNSEQMTEELQKLLKSLGDKDITHVLIIGDSNQLDSEILQQNSNLSICCVPYCNFNEVLVNVDYGILSGGNGTLVSALANKLTKLIMLTNFDDQRNALEYIKKQTGVNIAQVDAAKWNAEGVFKLFCDLENPVLVEKADQLKELVGGKPSYENVLKLLDNLIKESIKFSNIASAKAKGIEG